MENDIDVTVLINRLPDTKWKCPHCGKMNDTAPTAEEILEEHFKYIEDCRWCGYLHSWELRLTADFKKKVLALFENGELKN